MPFTIHSKVRDVLADERAKAVIERHLPGATSHPQLHLGLDMSLQELTWYAESGLTMAKLTTFLEDLNKL
jgi:hypothetical protein